MQRPFISIIMPVYNNEALLPNAVKSIIDQTFSDWELIIIDDGSTDNTPQVADNLANKDSRIKVIHQENQWIYRSFNNGYAAASGKYVFIVNSDDTINPESLQKIHDAAVIDNADIVLFNLVISVCDKFQNIIVDDIYNRRNNLKEDFSYNDLYVIHSAWKDFLRLKIVGQQCVYKSSIAKKIKYRTDIYGGDYYYNIQIADKIKSVAGTSYQVYNFFDYACENMNASSGKYYGYEHKMFNEFYTGYKKLFEKWNVFDNDCEDILAASRLNNLTLEIRSYSSVKCKLTIEEKIRRIITDSSDELVYSSAEKTGHIEEWESRILSGVRELLAKEIPDEKSEYYFIYELLESLLRYEKDEDDLRKIKEAVYNEKNPKYIGKCFLEKLKI